MTLAEKRMMVNDCQTGLSLPTWKVRGLASRRDPVLRMVADVAPNETPIPPFQAGDAFYVREAWTQENPDDPTSKVIYKADTPRTISKKLFWNSPVSMPREIARNFFQVTSVKLERLHDAKVDDFHREGLPNCAHFNECFSPCQHCTKRCSPKQQYKLVWNNNINDRKDQIYEENPWTWVIYLAKLT